MKTPSEAAREYAEKYFPTNVYVGTITARDRQIAAEEAFLAGVAWAERFILVSEELPEECEPVFIKTTDGYMSGFTQLKKNTAIGLNIQKPMLIFSCTISLDGAPIEHGKE